MLFRPTHNRIWGEGIPPSSCDHCHNGRAEVFLSTRSLGDDPAGDCYLCGDCLMSIVLEAFALVGVSSVDVLTIPMFPDEPDPTDPIREEQGRKERDWRN